MRSVSASAQLPTRGFAGEGGGVRCVRHAATARSAAATTTNARLVIPRLELVLVLTLVVPPRDPHVRGLLEGLARLAGHRARPVVGIEAVGAGDPVEHVLELVRG